MDWKRADKDKPATEDAVLCWAEGYEPWCANYSARYGKFWSTVADDRDEVPQPDWWCQIELPNVAVKGAD